jgi:thioredoxin-like negative regulator of GroEL
MNITYITAPWCPTCKALLARTHALAVETSAGFRVVDIGTPEGEQEALPYSPTALPTVVVERHDVGPVARLTGTFDFGALRAILTS